MAKITAALMTLMPIKSLPILPILRHATYVTKGDNRAELLQSGRIRL